MEYYVSKENLGVDFTEELDGEDSSMQEDDSQVSLPGLDDHLAKDQTKSQFQALSGANTSELEGCLNVISNPPSTGNFDDNIEIDFGRPLLESPIPPYQLVGVFASQVGWAMIGGIAHLNQAKKFLLK